MKGSQRLRKDLALCYCSLTGLVFHSFLALESNSLEIKENCILEIFHISTPSVKSFSAVLVEIWKNAYSQIKKKHLRLL